MASVQPLPKRDSGTVSRLIQAFTRKKRAQDRQPREGALYLFAGSDLLGEANLVDESAGGAKISCSSPYILPYAKYALNPHTAQVHTLELAWQSGREAGYRYTAVSQLRGYVATPELQRMKEFWITIAGAYSKPTPKGVLGGFR